MTAPSPLKPQASSLTPASRHETIRLANLEPVRLSRHTASARVQRALLFALAAHDGKPVTTWQLKADSDLGERCVRLAIQALELAGLVFVVPGRPNSYHIRWERLAQLPKAVPA